MAADNAAPPSPRWFGYCRVSTDKQVAGTSLDDQKRRVESVAGYHGATITTLFVEEGVSGSIPLGQRPRGFEMVAGAVRGDTVVVSKLDRAFRNTIDALGVIERFRARGVQIILADISVEPLTQDGVGRLFFTIMASLAEFERERIAERTKAGKRRVAEQGGFLGGTPPAEMKLVPLGNGKSRVVIDEANVPVLEFARTLREGGAPLRDVEVLVKAEFPDHPLAQARNHLDWWRYFKRLSIVPPPRPKAALKPKGRKRDRDRKVKYLKPLMPARETYT